MFFWFKETLKLMERSLLWWRIVNIFAWLRDETEVKGYSINAHLHTCTRTGKYGQCAKMFSIFCIHCKSHVILLEFLLNLSRSDVLNQPRHNRSYCHIVLLLQIPFHEVMCVYKVGVHGVLQHTVYCAWYV